MTSIPSPVQEYSDTSSNIADRRDAPELHTQLLTQRFIIVIRTLH